MAQEPTLAQRVRSKYPDAYGQLSDQDLEAAVLKKYPGTYDHLPRTQAEPAVVEPQGDGYGANLLTKAVGAGRGLIGGVGMGVMSTLAGVAELGQKVAKNSILSRVLPEEAFGEIRTPAVQALTTPQSTPQHVGKFAEQAAEFMVPGMAAARADRGGGLFSRIGAEAATAGTVGAAQTGGDVAGAAIPAVVAGAVPAVGAAAKAIVPPLKKAASNQVQRAFGPTKERFKAITQKRTPAILDRGIRGSREQIQQRAADQVETLGVQIDDALTTHGSRQAGVRPVIDALEQAKDQFRTTNSAGAGVTIDPRPINQLEKLQATLAELGDDARVDQLVAVRRAWDKVVSQAGGFQQRAPGAVGMPLREQTEAWAKKEATTAIRKHLDTAAPELSAINKEYAFWRDIDDVLTQTIQRTGPQGAGLVKEAADITGHMVGGFAGAPLGPKGAVAGAFLTGKAFRAVAHITKSPRWQLASAQHKHRLAEAIASGDAAGVEAAARSIAAAIGAAVPDTPNE